MGNAAATAERWFQAADKQDTGALPALVTPDCVMTAPGGVTLQGPDQIAQWMSVFYAAFPDISHPIDRIVPAGNTVTVELRAVGTHTGPLASPAGEVPATGRDIELRVANLLTVNDEDRVTSVHVYFDQMQLLEQLGLLPTGRP
jgi:ketosteroid isomerase-like protein